MDTKTFDQRYRSKYLCFSLDESVEEAREKYFKKYKEPPQDQFIEMNLLWLGPIPDPLEPTQLASSQLTGPGSHWDQAKMF